MSSVLLAIALPMHSAGAARLASCAVPSINYGTATMQLNVSEAGDYKIWTHMYAPDSTNDSFMLELDGNSCFVVGNGGVQNGAWAWVGHKDGNTTNYVTATLSSGNHTIKLIGSEPGVKIDRVLASADQSCVPTGTGDNCMTVSDTTKPVVNITSPEDAAAVKGVVTIKADATDDTGIAKVEFYVQGNLVSTVTSSPYEYSWDTSELVNQIYTVTTKAYDAEGNVSSDSITLALENETAQTVSAASNLTSVATSTNSVELKWDGSAEAVSYRVARNGVVIVTTNQTTYTDNTAVSGETYEYTVVAVGINGEVSDSSSVSQVTMPTPPAGDTVVPTTPADLTVAAQGTNQINLSWTASTDDVGISGYDIYRNSDEDKTFRKVATTTETSYGDSDVYDNTTFTYYIIANDAAGNASEPSAQSAATTPSIRSRNVSSVRGTIHDSHGKPIAGARVAVWVGSRRYHATTNWRGRYVITNVPSGKYEVSFGKGGYERTSSYVSLRSHLTRWLDAKLRY
jgi:hypothetical protein